MIKNRTGMSASSTDLLLIEEAQTQDPRWSDITRRGMEASRKKVRKGTRSCWECKRRKNKCEFNSPSDLACVRCRRRGTKCVGQQYPDQPSRRLDDRIVRVEALIEQLANRVKDSSSSDLNNAPLGNLSGLDISQHATAIAATTVTASSSAMAMRLSGVEGSIARNGHDKIRPGIATSESIDCGQSPSKHREPVRSFNLRSIKVLKVFSVTLILARLPFC
jgi:hypothetical protein